MSNVPYVVRQTDCRTGWQIVDRAGKVVPWTTFRTRAHAVKAAQDMNRKAQS